MPVAAAVPLIASGISALGGWLANRKKQVQEQSSQTQNVNNLSMPEYDDKTAILRDRLINMFLSRAEFPEDLMTGYTTEGLKNINRSSDIASKAVESMLSQRGLRRTGMGANAIVGNELNRLNQQSSFLNSISLLKDQLLRERLGDAASFFGSIPKGARTTGTTTTTGAQTGIDPGNPFAGGITGLGSSLAYFYGRGAFGGGNPQIPDFTYDNADSAYNVLTRQPAQSYFNPQRYSLISPSK